MVKTASLKSYLKKIHNVVTIIKLININNIETTNLGFLFLKNFATKSSIIHNTPWPIPQIKKLIVIPCHKEDTKKTIKTFKYFLKSPFLPPPKGK